MRLLARLVFIFFCLFLSSIAVAETAIPGFIVVNYHDILEEEERVPPFDRIAVCKQHLEDHFAWLKKK